METVAPNDRAVRAWPTSCSRIEASTTTTHTATPVAPKGEPSPRKTATRKKVGWISTGIWKSLNLITRALTATSVGGRVDRAGGKARCHRRAEAATSHAPAVKATTRNTLGNR